MKYKKLLFYLYIYKILKTTQQFYFNKSKILGQDRFMVASKQNEYKNYPMVVYYLKENHNNLYNFLYNKLKEKINYKKSPIRLKQKLSPEAVKAKAIRDKKAMMSEHGKKKKRENQVKRREAIKAGKNIKGKDYDHKDGRFKSIKANRGNDGKGTKREGFSIKIMKNT